MDTAQFQKRLVDEHGILTSAQEGEDTIIVRVLREIPEHSKQSLTAACGQLAGMTGKQVVIRDPFNE